MAETRRKYVAALALAAGLSAGGVAGFVLGVPGVSHAQTTTTVPGAPSTTALAAPDAGETTPYRGSRENCPEKDGAGAEGSGTGGATNAGLRRGGGRV